MSSMQLSCTTCCLRGRGRDEIEETFRYAPDAGYRYWGLGGTFTVAPGLIQWLDIRKIKRRMREVGLIGLTEVWTPPIPTDSVENAKLGAEHVVLAAKVALEMDCGYIVQTGGPRRKGGISQTIEGLKRLADLLADLPVKVCIEPHVGSQILTIDDYSTILSELDNLQFGITVDTGHFHSAGVDFISLIKKYPNRIYNVHLKDHVGKQSVPIGKGEIDLKGLIKVLKNINYKNFLALELEVTDPENAPEYIRDAYKYLTNLLGEV